MQLGVRFAPKLRGVLCVGSRAITRELACKAEGVLEVRQSFFNSSITAYGT